MTPKPNFLVVIACLICATSMQAGIVMYTDQAAFDAQGTVRYDTLFSCEMQYCGVSNPYTIGGVTYINEYSDLVIIGTSSTWRPVAPLLIGWSGSGTWAFIEQPLTYNMVGFSLGSHGENESAMIDVETNLGRYHFDWELSPDSAHRLQFYGFIAGPGEYFEFFSIWNFYEHAEGITNVELGSTVPEPSTVLMLGSGALAIAGILRRNLSL